MGSFPIGTLFAILAMKDELSGPITGLARTVVSKSGEISTAVEGAAVKIGNVNKLLRDFSGLPIMNKAEEMAAAVAKIGGAAKLTADEQAKVNAVVNEAIRKYQALGQEVPAHLADLAVATTQIIPPTERAAEKVGVLDQKLDDLGDKKSIFQDLDGALNKVGLTVGALGVGAGVGGLITLGREAISAASHLTDLRDATGLSLQELQRYEVAGAKVGVSLDTAARGVQQLQRNLVDGDDGAVNALSAMNLNVQQLLAMSPGEMFEAIAAKVALIPDPAHRTATAVEVLGKSGQQLLPLLLADIEKLNEGVAKMSDEAVENLDRLDDRVAAFSLSVRNNMGQLISDLESGKLTATSVGNPLGPMVAILSFANTRRREIADTAKAIGGEDGMAGALDRVRAAGDPVVAIVAGLAEQLPKAADAARDFERAGGDAVAKKNIAAWEAYLERVKALRHELSGGALRQKVKELADAVAGLTKEQLASPDVMARVAERVKALAREGAPLTAELLKIWAANVSLNDIVPRVTVGLGDQARQGRSLAAAFKDAAERAEFLARVERGLLNDKVTNALPNFMKLPGTDGLQAFRDGFAAVIGDTKDWSGAIDDVVRSLDVLGQFGGDSFGAMTTSIGQAVQGTMQLHQALSQIAGAKGKDGAIDWAAMAAGLASTATAILTVVAAFYQLIQVQNEAKKQERRLNRMETQNTVATELLGLERNFVFSEQLLDRMQQLHLRLMAIVAFTRGIPVSEVTGPLLEHVDRMVSALNITSLLAEAGGLTPANVKRFEDLALMLFDVFELGGAEAELAMRELNAMIGEFAAHADETGGLWSDAFKDIIQRARDTGEEFAALNAAIEAQVDKLATATESLLKGPIDSQVEFDRLSRVALSTFNTIFAQTGSVSEAWRAVSGSVGSLSSQLQKVGEETGFVGNAALDVLLDYEKFAGQNAELLNSASALNEILVAQANLGILTADSFADLQAQAVGTYQEIFNAAVRAGFGQEEAQRLALEQMRPMLETIARLHDEGKVSIDEETQALINQAREQGVIAETTKSEHQQVIDTLREGFTALLTGELPAHWRTMADAALEESERAARGAQGFFNSIRPPMIGFEIEYPEGHPHGGTYLPPGGFPGPAMADGGIVRRPTVALIGERGPEAVIPLDRLGETSRPTYSGDVVFVLDGTTVGRLAVERLLTALEYNDGGGAPVSPVMRVQKALGIA